MKRLRQECIRDTYNFTPGIPIDLYESVVSIFHSAGWYGPLQLSFDAVSVAPKLGIKPSLGGDDEPPAGKVSVVGVVAKKDATSNSWIFTPYASSAADLTITFASWSLANHQIVGVYSAPFEGTPKVVAFMIGNENSSYSEQDLADWFKILMEGWKNYSDVHQEGKSKVFLVTADQAAQHMRFFRNHLNYSTDSTQLPELLQKELLQLKKTYPDSGMLGVGFHPHGSTIQGNSDVLHVIGIANQRLMSMFSYLTSPSGSLVHAHQIYVLCNYLDSQRELGRPLSDVRLTKKILALSERQNKKLPMNFAKPSVRRLFAEFALQQTIPVEEEDGIIINIPEESKLNGMIYYTFSMNVIAEITLSPTMSLRDRLELAGCVFRFFFPVG